MRVNPHTHGWWFIFLMFITASCQRPQNAGIAPSPTPIIQTTSQTLTQSPSPSLTPVEDRILGRGLKLESEKFRTVRRQVRYDIQGEYPRIIPITDRRARRFNNEVNRKIRKHYVYMTAPKRRWLRDLIQTIPEQNPLQTAEFSYQVLTTNKDFLSVRFQDINYTYPAAHPLEDFFTVNFELKNGRVLLISSVFKRNTRYKNTIARLCEKQLTAEGLYVHADAILTDLHRNIEWNVTREGLVINFDRCAISSCGDGQRSVTIPYGELENILNPRVQTI